MTSSSERTAGPAETEALGARLAASLRPGDVVLLEGDVGAGKTTLVRGALRALGHHGRVQSPTFTLARRYDDTRIPVSHLDLYRLAEAAGADLEDLVILDDELAPDRIAFVEWPGAAPDVLAGRGTHRIELIHAGEDLRDIQGV